MLIITNYREMHIKMTTEKLLNPSENDIYLKGQKQSELTKMVGRNNYLLLEGL